MMVIEKRKTVDEILYSQNSFNIVCAFITWVNDYLFEENSEQAINSLHLLCKELNPLIGYEALNRLLNYSVLADELPCSTILKFACTNNVSKDMENKVKYIRLI